jgi:hypothetical protein
MTAIDMQPALVDWSYDPDEVSVRRIICADGRERVQMRIELGILQMEPQGRPDGEKPFGYESLLHFYQDRLASHEEVNGTSLGFSLSLQQCRALRIEASQYYRRYVAFFVLEEYGNVLRDAKHNLEVFDLCSQHAFETEDRAAVEPYRPYALMMAARARAYRAQQEKRPESALAHVNRGIIEIRAHYDDHGRGQAAEACEEVRILQHLAQDFTRDIPPDSPVLAQRALREALEDERFEEAARIRDSIKQREAKANS